MKSYWLALALVAAFGLQVTPQVPTSTVRGLVTKAGSTEPLPGAEITLTSGTVLAADTLPGSLTDLLANASVRVEKIEPSIFAPERRDTVVTFANTPVTGGTVAPIIQSLGRPFTAIFFLSSMYFSMANGTSLQAAFPSRCAIGMLKAWSWQRRRALNCAVNCE